jgi:hypothetical protein
MRQCDFREFNAEELITLNETRTEENKRNSATDLKSNALRDGCGDAPPLKRVKAVQDENY